MYAFNSYAVYHPRPAYQQEVRPHITATSDLNEMDTKIFDKVTVKKKLELKAWQSLTIALTGL